MQNGDSQLMDIDNFIEKLVKLCWPTSTYQQYSHSIFNGSKALEIPLKSVTEDRLLLWPASCSSSLQWSVKRSEKVQDFQSICLWITLSSSSICMYLQQLLSAHFRAESIYLFVKCNGVTSTNTTSTGTLHLYPLCRLLGCLVTKTSKIPCRGDRKQQLTTRTFAQETCIS